jgi:[ribosomal protein S5]-alanine N-acetyltransferase
MPMKSRINLEDLSHSHIGELFSYFAEPALYDFIPLEPPTDENQFGIWVDRKLQGSTDRDQVWLNWVLRDNNDSTAVGFIEVTILRKARSAYLAYFTFRPFWQRGFAREGCQTVIGMLRERADVDFVTCEVDSENQASVALLRSLGFVQTDYRSRADFFKNRWSDEISFELQL